jgi:Ni,Fe-hydrogenase III component G
LLNPLGNYQIVLRENRKIVLTMSWGNDSYPLRKL